MIVGIPGAGALVALAVCWLGATAPAGRHVRPGRLARLARAAWELRNGLPVHDDLDDDDDPDAYLPPPTPESWHRAFAGAYLHWAAADHAITPDEWRQAMMRATSPHLFSPDWYRDMRISHIRWATMLWEEIRTMKREAGIGE